MPPVTVRLATLEDVEFLGQVMLGAHLQEHPDFPDEATAAWIEGAREDTREQVLGLVKDSTMYVIQADTERVGRLRVVRPPDRHLLAGIQIIPTHQRKGVGTAVITGLLQEARDAGVPLELKVSKNNADAERLYRRLGFLHSGVEGDEFVMTAE